MASSPYTLTRECAAEFLGTAILIFFGLGAVHNAVLTGSYSSVFQVGLMWGIGVMVAAYAVGEISGAHLNPAVTIALAVSRGFPSRKVLPYALAQTVGASFSAGVLYLIFSGTISAHELKEGILRGAAKSVVTASMYGEYFPNPTVGIHGFAESGYANLSWVAAAAAEFAGTAVLLICILAVTDAKNSGAPLASLGPLFVGLTVAAVIGVIGPLTQACLNPARDFGPRFVAYLAGWGGVAFPGPRGLGSTLAVYLAAPIAGGVLGARLYAALRR